MANCAQIYELRLWKEKNVIKKFYYIALSWEREKTSRVLKKLIIYDSHWEEGSKMILKKLKMIFIILRH